MIQSSIGRERCQGGSRPGPGGAGGRVGEEVSFGTPEGRGQGEEEGQDTQDSQRRKNRSLSCGNCGLFCATAQQLWRHVEQEWEGGGNCLQEMGHPNLDSLKLHIRNTRRRNKVGTIMNKK